MTAVTMSHEARNVVVAFGPVSTRLLEDERPDTLVMSDSTPAADFEWQPLARDLPTGYAEPALRLLDRLNELAGANGVKYAAMFRYHGYEPWWFHQQLAFDEYVLPFTRYTHVLSRCVTASRITIHDCPEDLRRILPLMPFYERVTLPGDKQGASTTGRGVRRLVRKAFYDVMSALAVARATVLRPHMIVYAVDAVDDAGRNRWLDGLHRALTAKGVRFLDILWSPGGRRAIRNAILRKRFALYDQSDDGYDDRGPGSDNVLQYADLAEQFLHTLAHRVLLVRVRLSIASITRYERILRLIRPKGAFLMDDGVHAFELVVACKRRGIPTVGVQHGQFSRYTVGLMAPGCAAQASHAFDRYCVWSDFFNNLLVQHSNLFAAESITVTGMCRSSAALPQHAPKNTAQRTRVMFVAEHFDVATQRNEVASYIRTLSGARFDLCVKLHPSVRIPADLFNAQIKVASSPLPDALAHADVVVASHSSAVFESVLHGLPVVLFGAGRYHDPHGLAAAGLAGYAASPADIVQEVEVAAGLPSEELHRRRMVAWSNGEANGGDAIVNEMEKLILRDESAHRMQHDLPE